MFTQIAANEMPTAARKGRNGKDHTADPLYQGLKSLPVNPDGWNVMDGEFSEDNARKLQSKIAAFAKAGAGTFKTSYRQSRVYVCKMADTYQQQRGA